VPRVLAAATDVVESELTIVAGAVVPAETALSVLGAVYVGSLIPGFIWPGLHAVTMLLVVFPLPFVDGAIVVDVLTCPVGFVIVPFALINVSI